MADLAYKDYWQRKKLLSAGSVPHFPVRRWWRSDTLCEIERVYYDALRPAARLLDVGAGDLRVKQKFEAAGFQGEYHTQDIGTEFQHTYTDLAQVTSPYDAILCLDVIEHLPLEPGLGLVVRLTELLTPGGVLIVQTPNARCVRHPLSWDMTHLHVYNLPDLWAFCRTLGLEAEGFRVVFTNGPGSGLLAKATGLVGRTLTRLLGCDYTDNIALLARKPKG